MRAFIANARVLGMVCRWLLSDLLGPMTLSICIAQLNFTVGDLRGNAQKIIDAAHAAHAGERQGVLGLGGEDPGEHRLGQRQAEPGRPAGDEHPAHRAAPAAIAFFA